MEFAVLGELRASDGEVDRTPRGQRSRDLLAVLLTRRGQAVDSTVLLDLVWGHAAAGLDISVVHTQVARLRRALGRRFIQTAESGYRLTDASTDADRFAELVARARGGTIGEPVTDLLREALALWRGDRAYSDVTLDLVAPEVTALQEARVAALELLAETLLGVADPTGPSGQAGPQRWPGSGPQAWSDPGGDNDRAGVEAALGVGRELIAREPLRERGYELAMLAAARSGRQVEALTMYERLRSTLRQELGIAPSASTRELHARLLRREHPLAIPVRAAAPTRAGTAPPAPTTAMIGRDRDMTCVARLLRDRRAVTITGTGGVGKSRLLSELHGRLAPGWSGYFDVGASTATSLGELAEEVGHAVRVRVDPPDPVATLVTAIGSRSLLLVVDEAETRLELCADLLGRLLGGCPGVRVLTASRRPLGLVGEAIHVLDPLECPDAQAGPSAISTAPAVLLLRERIADHAPDLVIADDQWAQLRDLARGMDGLPLALELLAARTRTCTLEDLADTLVDPLRLTATERDRPARHRSVRRAIAWSVDHLTPVQRDALGCLAVFVGPFTADAAKAAAGPIDDFDEVLRCVVRDALVHVQRGPDGVTLRILTPTRAYALEELGPHCGLADAMARHRRWHGQRWRGALRSDALLADVRAHEPDYLHALNTALETGDRETTADLTLTLGKLWVFHDMLGPGLRWSARVLASGLLTPLETARILTMRSTLQSHHDPHQVRVDLSRAIPVLRRHGDVVWLTTAHLAAALERYAGGDLLGAREHAEQAVAASRGTHA